MSHTGDDDIDVDTVRRTGHFVYESGHHGDTWLDLDHLFVDQERLRRLADKLADRLRRHAVDIVCGPLVGGALLGQWVSHHLNVPFVYAERIPPTAISRVRYDIPNALSGVVAGMCVAIVDDAINAGSATLATQDEIARQGGDATVAASIFIREPGGIALLESSGLAVEHLVGVPFTIWEPARCPLCRDGVPLEHTT